jgi:hypothetical protein
MAPALTGPASTTGPATTLRRPRRITAPLTVPATRAADPGDVGSTRAMARRFGDRPAGQPGRR